jgi:hypothetical protein
MKSRLHSFAPRTALGLLGLLGLPAGCGYTVVEEPADCDERFSSQAVGVWSLRADGIRQSCKDKDLNGDLTLEMQPFAVKGTPLELDGSESVPVTDFEADAFVERIRHVRFRLELDDQVDFQFEGSSNTCSVDFTIREELKGKAFHEYEFHGYTTALGRIEGNFEGRGPSECASEGYFEISVD